MGVTGLWTVVAPTARPTSLASLNRKRLAVDASIWIYQFLKAVRDKEGNALRNSHVVGFFRRICKLLYFGIKPVFVFDGGAPALKRETIRRRKGRREGRREDAVRTAGKLLAVQMERIAEEDERRRKEKRDDDEEEIPEGQDLVYVEEIGMDEQERKRQRGEGFKRKDQYHLPDLDVSIADLGAPNDPRIMSQEELEEYARQFHIGEDINLYDFSKIDFESPFFLSLPPGDRYHILNAARLRSRLRMGYSKEQLDGMFPDRMAFSRFQIERVKERNELTQRLMNLNGMSEWDINQGGRIAGEKGKEYVLVKNDGVEGGWALGVVSNRQGLQKDNAIDIDAESEKMSEPDNDDEDEDFEDVAIEGLNRIPQTWKRKRQPKEVDYDLSYEDATAIIAKKRRAVYGARQEATEREQVTTLEVNDNVQEDSLFVPRDGANADEDDDLFEDVDIEAQPADEEDDDLQRAIAMSLEKPAENAPPQSGGFLIDEEHEDDALDMQAALAESRMSKHQSKANIRPQVPEPAGPVSAFSGPLPFESLNLGQSLLGKKKSKKIEEGLAGGFDRDLGEDVFRKERPPQPMPEWFNATPSTKDFRRPQLPEQPHDDSEQITYSQEKRATLRRHQTGEVIDLEAEDSQQLSGAAIDISSDEDGTEGPLEEVPEDPEWEIPDEVEQQPSAQEELRKKADDQAREERYMLAREIAAENEPEEPTMGEVADDVRAEPPPPTQQPVSIPSPKPNVNMQPETVGLNESRQVRLDVPRTGLDKEVAENQSLDHIQNVSDDEGVDWSASDAESDKPNIEATAEDSDEEFEDVEMPDAETKAALTHQTSTNERIERAMANPYLIDDDSEHSAADDGPATAQTSQQPQEEDYFSSDDEELMRQLANEAEEHLRFASSLNNSTSKHPEQAARDFETELKQLRNQQKRDRRDADEVTQTMIQECQALLRLFGLPYITAPMEAEAQCAELVTLGLVDGIVTDDSDIFLFGGTRIYKNMFNAAKFVECYLASDLEKEYALDRRKLIRFAHLLGSDYTEGIPGVGPVTALEILTDFATLEEFKAWCSKIQISRPGAAELTTELSTPFRRKFQSAARKRVFLPPSFPDLRVDQAYLHPEVDGNPEEFMWGVPDLDKLRAFLMATIGWSQERTDEVLVPVVRDMNRRETEGTQSNITRFFAGAVGVGAREKIGGAGGGSGGSGAGGGRGGNTAAAAGGAGAGKVADDATAQFGQRNRSGKESGRMKNAYKRLKGEAERRKDREREREREGEGVAREGVGEGEDVGGSAGDASVSREKRSLDGGGITTLGEDGRDADVENMEAKDDDDDPDEEEKPQRTRKGTKKTRKPRKAKV